MPWPTTPPPTTTPPTPISSPGDLLRFSDVESNVLNGVGWALGIIEIHRRPVEPLCGRVASVARLPIQHSTMHNLLRAPGPTAVTVAAGTVGVGPTPDGTCT